MTRMIAFLSAGLLLAFTLVIAALRAQPEDADLSAFLLPPEGCAMPCWEGIQPGVTTAEQALAILRALRWVKRAVVTEQVPYAYIYWEWSADKPAFAGDPAALMPPVIWVQRGVVQLIIIPTSIPYGAAHLLLGTPGVGNFNVSDYRSFVTLGGSPNTFHTAAYFDGRVALDTRVICPINLARFWDAPIKLTYSSRQFVQAIPMAVYDLARWFYRSDCDS